MTLDVDAVLLPAHFQPYQRDRRVVIVFDVLRATTSITAALAGGVREIRVFSDTAAARLAAAACTDADRPLLCGEEKCLPPEGFDLGNSPGAFSPTCHGGRSLCMSTTNGTRAMLAARGAPAVFAGALVNASAVAAAALDVTTRHGAAGVTLLCAGTAGEVAAEDVIGAGAVIEALSRIADVRLASDTAGIARDLFRFHREDLRQALARTRGGRNVLAAGLGPDIDFAARLDAVPVVGLCSGEPPAIGRWAADSPPLR